MMSSPLNTSYFCILTSKLIFISRSHPTANRLDSVFKHHLLYASPCPKSSFTKHAFLHNNLSHFYWVTLSAISGFRDRQPNFRWYKTENTMQLRAEINFQRSLALNVICHLWCLGALKSGTPISLPEANFKAEKQTMARMFGIETSFRWVFCLKPSLTRKDTSHFDVCRNEVLNKP